MPVSNGGIALNTATLQVVGSTPLTINQVTTVSGTSTINVLNANQTVTISSALTGAANLTETGPGTLLLTNTAGNNFGGTAGSLITVNGGGKIEGAVGTAATGTPSALGVQYARPVERYAPTRSRNRRRRRQQRQPRPRDRRQRRHHRDQLRRVERRQHDAESGLADENQLDRHRNQPAFWNGTVIFNTGSGTLNSNASVVFGTAPALVDNGTMIGPWSVVQQASSTNADFTTVSTTAPFALGIMTYNTTTIGTTATDIVNANSAATVPNGAAAFSVKDSAALSLAGTLTLGNGTGQAGLILNTGGSITGGTLAFGGAEGDIYTSGTSSISAAITGSAGNGVTFFGPGTVTLTGTNSYTGATNLNGPGAVLVQSDASLGAASNRIILSGGTLSLDTSTGIVSLPNTRNITLSANATGGINVTSSANAATVAGVISNSSFGAGVAFTKSGSGTLVLTSANSYSGRTYINGGVLSVSSLANGASNSGIGSSNAAPSSLIFNGGTLQYNSSATAAANIDRLFTVNASSAIDASGPTGDTLSFTNTGSLLVTTGVNSTLTLTGANTGNNSLTPAITDSVAGAFTTSVAKTGAGTWILAGASSYSGSTAVSAGTLLVNGSLSSGASVSGGILGGTGTISSAITVTSAGTLAPGVAGIGTLATGSLAVAGTYAVTISGSSTNSDTVNNAGTVNITGATLSLTVASAPTVNGVYTVINNLGSSAVTGQFTFGGTVLANGATFTDATSGKSFKIFYNGGDGNDVILIEATAPTNVYVSSTNFGMSSAVFPGQTVDGDQTTAGTQTALVGLSAYTSVASGIAGNPTSGVVFVNPGTYAESATLNNNETLRLLGNVTVNTLDSALGTTIDLQANTLTTGIATGNNTIAGAITGGGNLIKAGADTLTLTGTDTYSGTTTVSGGTLVVDSSNQTSSVSVAASRHLFGGNGTIAGSVLPAPAGTVTTQGASAAPSAPSALSPPAALSRLRRHPVPRPARVPPASDRLDHRPCRHPHRHHAVAQHRHHRRQRQIHDPQAQLGHNHHLQRPARRPDVLDQRRAVPDQLCGRHQPHRRRPHRLDERQRRQPRQHDPQRGQHLHQQHAGARPALDGRERRLLLQLGRQPEPIEFLDHRQARLRHHDRADAGGHSERHQHGLDEL